MSEKIGIYSTAEVADAVQAFADEINSKPKQTLSEALRVQVLQEIMRGDCKITGWKTDHTQKKAWVEFTWEWEDEA